MSRRRRTPVYDKDRRVFQDEEAFVEGLNDTRDGERMFWEGTVGFGSVSHRGLQRP